MRIWAQFFLGVMAVVGLGFYLLLGWISRDVEPSYRKATEEPLVDFAKALAGVAATTARGGEIDAKLLGKALEGARSQPLSARIYDHTKQQSDFRVYVTDAKGIVLFDSQDPTNVGEDFSQWLDVARTLRGQYGARTTRDVPEDPSTSVMYVAAPILVDGVVAGVLTVGKPTRTARAFTEGSRRKLFLAGWIVFSCVILVVVFVSARVTGPLRALAEYARAVRDGRRAEAPRRGAREVRELAQAFDEMRDALEGKHYVERYVQTLTHEIKSPLSAIRGAVELLGEEMPPEQRARFVENARNESSRIQALVEKLLLLSSLESRKGLEAQERIDLRELVAEVAGSLGPILERRRLRLEIESGKPCPVPVVGDRFQMRQAVENLLQNALDFSPDGGPITAALSRTADGLVELKVLDRGAGIPDFALGKVFDRFYSLPRPDTGRKSSGLGLSLVKEVALLHRGSVELRNREGGGACAILRLPAAPG